MSFKIISVLTVQTTAIAEWGELAKNFGVPVCCLIACGFFIYRLQLWQREDRKKENEYHHAKEIELSKIIENNTAAIVELTVLFKEREVEKNGN